MKSKGEIFWKFLVCKFFLIAFLLTTPIVKAIDLNTSISDSDKQQFDQILSPVTKIYNFVKYGISLLAVIALMVTAGSYMFAGNDIKRREASKTRAGYILIGLALIWAAPYIVNLFTS